MKYELYKDTYNPIIEGKQKLVDYIIEITPQRVRAENYFYSYTNYDKRMKQFVRHVYCARTENSGTIVKEVRRDYERKPSVWRDMYYVSYGMARGTHVIWKAKRYYYEEFEPKEKWFALDDYLYDKVARYTTELNTVENLIASDNSLRYFGWVKDSGVEAIDYIKAYRQYPIVETFMKLGLYRFILDKKAIETTTENKGFRKWLCANAENCHNRAFTTCYNSYKKNPNTNPKDYYNSLMYRIECGKELAYRDKEIYNKILHYTTQERLYEFGDSVGLSSYFDYLKACEWLKLDFNDTKVLFPKDFKTYHDLYCEQYGRHLEEERIKRELEEKKQREIEFKTTNEKMLEVAKQYQFCNYHNANFVIIVATNVEELINEGEKMHHCVGRMGYDKKQANGDSLICFVRKANEIDKPLATLELNLRRKEIAQCYCEHNTLPSEEIKNFVDNEWLPLVQTNIKKMTTARA